MGFMDRVKGMLGQHSDKTDQGVDRSAETLDKRTGGKHSDKIDRGSEKSKEAMDRYADKPQDEGGGGGRAA